MQLFWKARPPHEGTEPFLETCRTLLYLNEQGLRQHFCWQAACHFSVVTILYLEQLLHGNPIHRVHLLLLFFFFLNEQVGKETKYICFGFLNGERGWGEQQTLGEKQGIFFFLFLDLSPSWVDTNQKGVIKKITWYVGFSPPSVSILMRYSVDQLICFSVDSEFWPSGSLKFQRVLSFCFSPVC